MGQNNLVPLDHMSGSRPLKIKSHELYCRHRASALGRIEAWRYFRWIIAGLCGVEIIFGDEKVLDIGFVYCPEAFFDAGAFFSDAIFRLLDQIVDAGLNEGRLFQPSGIDLCHMVIGSDMA